MSIILITPNELAELIKANVREALAERSLPASPSAKPLSIIEAADYLGLPKSTLYQMTAARQIPHKKVGKRLVFLVKELDEWVLSKKKKTRTEIENEALLNLRKGGQSK